MRNGYRLLSLLAAAWLPAGAGTVTSDPPAVQAGHAATVAIAGHSQACVPIVTNRRVRVDGSSLVLSAAFESNPAADCMPGPLPYAVDFDLPALPTGEYTVLMSVLPACAYSATPCPFAFLAPDTGRLIAAGTADLKYGIHPAWTPPAKPFRLRLTAPAFTCGSRFSSLTAQVAGHRITLGFEHQPHPEADCPAGAAEYGPAFDLSGLEPGVYQVFAAPGVICDRGLCAPAAGPATLAGALEVQGIPAKPLWIDPHTVKAGVSDSIALRGTGFACNDVLTNKQTEVKGGAILLHYSIMRTKKLCMVDTLFIGQEFFPLPALAPGAYTVGLQPPADCPYVGTLCGKGADSAGVDLSKVDTLYAEAALGVKDAGRKPAAARGRAVGANPRVPWRGETADLAGRRRKP
jgi:hypothetical protein